MKRASAAIAAAAALSLVAATGQTSVEPAGSASTALKAVELNITGVPVPVDGATLLDIASFASTDVDTARNPEGSPFARITALPLQIAGRAVGETQVASNGDGSKSIGALEQSVGPVTAVVNGAELSAVADADSALALLRGATARVAALEALGISVNEAGLSSSVDPSGAKAVQGLKVSGLKIALGDLLPAALSSLPLDVVIQLAGKLAGTLSGSLGDLAKTVVSASNQAQTLLAQLGAEAAKYDEVSALLKANVAAISQVNAQIDAVQAEITKARAALSTAQGGGTVDPDVLDDLLGTVDGVTGGTDGATDPVGGVVDGLLGAAQTTDVVSELNALIDSLEGQLDTLQADLSDLEDEQQELVDQLTTILNTISSLVDTLEGVLATLVEAVQDLLAQLPAILAALGDAELVDIGAIDLGLTAEANGANANAVLGCAVDHITVVGASIPAPDCSAPLTEASDVLNGALGQVEGVLAALPVVGGVVPDATLEMFADAYEKTEKVDGYNTAEAHVTALHLAIPSVELGAVTDGILSGLTDADLSALLAELEATLAQDAADPLFDALTGLAGTLDATLGDVTAAVPAVTDVETTVTGLLGQLPAADALAGLATPGVELTVDPTVNAQFRDGAPVPPAGGGPGDPNDPNGAPDDDGGSLPTTGGGLALLGLLAVAGAAGLRRRHG